MRAAEILRNPLSSSGRGRGVLPASCGPFCSGSFWCPALLDWDPLTGHFCADGWKAIWCGPREMAVRAWWREDRGTSHLGDLTQGCPPASSPPFIPPQDSTESATHPFSLQWQRPLCFSQQLILNPQWQSLDHEAGRTCCVDFGLFPTSKVSLAS